MARVRTKKIPHTYVGTVNRRNPFTGGTSSQSSKIEAPDLWVCDDSLSPPPHVIDQNLSIVKKRDCVVRLDGQVKHRILSFLNDTTWYTGYPVARTIPTFGSESITPISSYVAEALSNAAPNEGVTDLGELIQSVLQLPGLIASLQSQAANLIPRNSNSIPDISIGEAHLTNEMGISPTVNDVNTLAGIQRAIAAAMQNYDRAEEGSSFGGTLSKGGSTSRRFVADASPFSIVTIALDNKYEYRIWYSLRFQPNGGKPPSELLTFYQGINLDKPLVSLWNLIPWSFLIDYFVSFGDFLQAKYSSHAIKSLCIMREQSAKLRLVDHIFEGTGLHKIHTQGVTAQASPNHFLTKERKVYTEIPHIPFHFNISGGQFANIVALLAANGRRSSSGSIGNAASIVAGTSGILAGSQ